MSVEKNLKIGNFGVSFSDLNVPVSGLPIEVIRTYDSRDKSAGDFGVGWNVSFRNIGSSRAACWARPGELVDIFDPLAAATVLEGEVRLARATVRKTADFGVAIVAPQWARSAAVCDIVPPSDSPSAQGQRLRPPFTGAPERLWHRPRERLWHRPRRAPAERLWHRPRAPPPQKDSGTAPAPPRKGGKQRVVPFGEVAALYLDNYLRWCRPGLLRQEDRPIRALWLTVCGQPMGYFLVRTRLQRYAEALGIDKPDAARAAPRLRDAPARAAGRAAPHPGAAGPRLGGDDADLCARLGRALEGNPATLPPAGAC